MGAPSPSSGRTAWVAFLQACVRGKDWPPEPVADGPAFVQSGPTTLEGVLSVWAAASSAATSRALGDAVLAIQEEGTSTERRAVRWVAVEHAPDAGPRLVRLLDARRDELRARTWLYTPLSTMIAIPAVRTDAVRILREEVGRPYPDEGLLLALARADTPWVAANIARLVAPSDGYTSCLLWRGVSDSVEMLTGIANAGEARAVALLRHIASIGLRHAAEALERDLSKNSVFARVIHRRSTGPLPEAPVDPQRPRDWRGVVLLAAGDTLAPTLEAIFEELLVSSDAPALAAAHARGDELLGSGTDVSAQHDSARRGWDVPRQAAARALLATWAETQGIRRWDAKDQGTVVRARLDDLPRRQQRELPRSVTPPSTCDVHCPRCGSGALDESAGSYRCAGCSLWFPRVDESSAAASPATP